MIVCGHSIIYIDFKGSKATWYTVSDIIRTLFPYFGDRRTQTVFIRIDRILIIVIDLNRHTIGCCQLFRGSATLHIPHSSKHWITCRLKLVLYRRTLQTICLEQWMWTKWNPPSIAIPFVSWRVHRVIHTLWSTISRPFVLWPNAKGISRCTLTTVSAGFASRSWTVVPLISESMACARWAVICINRRERTRDVLQWFTGHLSCDDINFMRSPIGPVDSMRPRDYRDRPMADSKRWRGPCWFIKEGGIWGKRRWSCTRMWNVSGNRLLRKWTIAKYSDTRWRAVWRSNLRGNWQIMTMRSERHWKRLEGGTWAECSFHRVWRSKHRSTGLMRSSIWWRTFRKRHSSWSNTLKIIQNPEWRASMALLHHFQIGEWSQSLSSRIWMSSWRREGPWSTDREMRTRAYFNY